MYEDTSPEMFERYLARLRAMTTVEKAQALDAMMVEGRQMAMIGLRMRHPQASEEELKLRLFVRFYGRELAQRYFQDVPDDAL
jgi:hypothetical protein